MMDYHEARRLGPWAARQFKAQPGGYEGACGLPDAPLSAAKLSECGLGNRRLSVDELIWLCAANGRADVLRNLADFIDGGEGEEVRIGRVSRQTCYAAADLARRIEDMDADQVRTAGEVHEVRGHAAALLAEATRLTKLAEGLETGPVGNRS